jgi:hypothetical protein
MIREPHGETGFSLLETLLGLTLTAMIGVLMMGSLQMGTRVWERRAASALPGEEQLILGQTGEWLALAMPANLRSVDDPPYAPFLGDANRVSFLYAAPGLGASPGVYAVDLALVESAGCQGGRRLMMRASRTMPADDAGSTAPPPAQERELVSCIEAPSFFFWGSLNDAPVAAWHADWQLQTKLPSVVRLSATSPEGVEHIVFTQKLLNTRF